MNSLFDLDGEVAVVIGATGALGGALAEALAAAGAAVAVLGRNAERGRACVDRIAKGGGRAQFFPADAAHAASLAEARASVEGRWERQPCWSTPRAAMTPRSP